MFRRFWSIFIARNKEFFRDSEALSWNFVFPFLIILGFYVIFQRGGGEEYKCGVIPPETSVNIEKPLPGALRDHNMLNFVEFQNRETGLKKLRLHKLELVMERGSDPVRYWIDSGSPKGAIAESLLLQALCDPEYLAHKAIRGTIKGERIDYIDWLFPGIIAMNMMFGSLYGVGYVTVRYRKIGALKRLRATPLTAFEYLTAQVISRIFLTLFSAIIVFIGCAILFRFQCKGSYLDLALIFVMGSASIISLGLVIAARITSEELVEGVLSMVTWPMMFLSEVWFSLEGAPEWVRKFSQLLPLTHLTEGMRKIMNEGAPIEELTLHIIALLLMTVIFMTIGSALFKWTKS